MAKNTSVTLGDHFDDFISKQLGGGRYASASEVVRAGLRSLEDRETKLAKLRQLIDEGESSGFSNYNYATLIDELDQENN